MTAQIKIEIINSQNPHLAEVKTLGRMHAKTLGMFPEGAFDDHASRNWIFGAVNAEGNCVGYVLYRAAKGRAMITHLCVDKNWQGKKIAKALVEKLRQITKEQGLSGIGLWCRRDYEISSAWPRLGFSPIKDRPGRSQDGKELTLWWMDHQLPDLFQIVAAAQPKENKLSAILDANVFFDLYDDDDDESAESQALLADWIQESVELCLSEEIRTEINRNPKTADRDRQRAQVGQHRIVKPTQEALKVAQNSLRQFFPGKMSESDESDFRQLSNTIAAGIQFFITRDTSLIKRADRIYDRCGVSLLRPVDLINQIDILKRESEYQPIRLGGSRFKVHLIKSQQESALAQVFRATWNGESATAFKKLLRGYLSSPQTTSCYVAENEQQQALALFVQDRKTEGIIELSLLRIGSGHLGPTIARHLLAKALQLSAEEARDATIVTESALDTVVLDALAESGFLQIGNGWAKLNPRFAGSAQQLETHLDKLTAKFAPVIKLVKKCAGTLKDWQKTRDVISASALECALWPAKILDADIPSFIIPIQANWAQSLFDENLAKQELFGERPELVLKREQVYYRAKNLSGLEAPGRILWYVSADKERQGTMSIRACSRLDEILIDRPKELYRRFRRLGVYEWPHIFLTAKKNLNTSIMALRFSDTELFNAPLPRDQFRKLGVKSNLQSPLRISKELFAELYRLGTQTP